MLAKYPVHAALPATDLERARRYYTDKLGITPTRERTDGLRCECADGTAIFLFPSSNPSQGGHTQAGFEVPDIEAAVKELRSRGVDFEEYTSGELITVDGIATEAGGDRAAWFRDSEGNLIGLVEFR